MRDLRHPWFLTAAVALLTTGLLLAADPPSERDGPVAERLRPRWRVGDQWIVETTAPSPQAADELPAPPAAPLCWHFAVRATEAVGGRNCLRVEVALQDGETLTPMATLWAEEKSLVPRQARTLVRVQGRTRPLTERYEFPRGAMAPVFGSLTALPLEMPAFTTTGARAPKFHYVVHTGEPGARAGDDLGFAVEVEQQVTVARPEDVRRALPGPSARDPAARLYEVRLKGPDREVRQLWQAGLPWPVYGDNGQVEARLIRVMPAR